MVLPVFEDVCAGVAGGVSHVLADGRRIEATYGKGVFSAILYAPDGSVLMSRVVGDGEYLNEYRRRKGRELAVNDLLGVHDTVEAGELAKYLRRRDRRRAWERTPRQRDLKRERTAEAARRNGGWPKRRHVASEG